MLRFILSIAVLGYSDQCSKDVPVSPPYAGKAIADDVAIRIGRRMDCASTRQRTAIIGGITPIG